MGQLESKQHNNLIDVFMNQGFEEWYKLRKAFDKKMSEPYFAALEGSNVASLARAQQVADAEDAQANEFVRAQEYKSAYAEIYKKNEELEQSLKSLTEYTETQCVNIDKINDRDDYNLAVEIRELKAELKTELKPTTWIEPHTETNKENVLREFESVYRASGMTWDYNTARTWFLVGHERSPGKSFSKETYKEMALHFEKENNELHQQLEKLEHLKNTYHAAWKECEEQLTEAEKVIEFYGEFNTWKTGLYPEGHELELGQIHNDKDREAGVPGKRAREYQRKYKGEK